MIAYPKIPIIKSNTTGLIARTSDIHNPRILFNLSHQQVRKQERPNMVGSKLALNTIGSLSIRIDSHNARIVDQNIDLFDQPIHLFGSHTDRSQVIEVQFDEVSVDFGVDLFDFFDYGRDPRLAAACQDELFGMAGCKSETCLFSQAAFARTSDND